MLAAMKMGEPVKAGDIAPLCADHVPPWVVAVDYLIALLTLDADRRVLRIDCLEPGEAVPAERAGAIPQVSNHDFIRAYCGSVPENLYAELPDAQGECMLVRRHDLTHGAV